MLLFHFSFKEFLVQAAGFFLLICGMCIYNGIVFEPLLRSHGCLTRRQNDLETLVANEDPGECTY